MANEFVIKNGYFSQGNSNVTGSLRVSSSIGVIGSGSDVLSVYGSQGNLLVVNDTFSGSLFTITDVSGYPILDITSDYYTSSINTVGFLNHTGSAKVTGSLVVSGGFKVYESTYGNTILDTVGYLYDTNGDISIIWPDRILQDTTNKTSIDWEVRTLYANDSSTVHIDWSDPSYMNFTNTSESSISRVLGMDGSNNVYWTSSTAIGGGGGSPGTNTTSSFASSTTWTFTHNLNSRYPIIQTLDSNFNQIIPQNITLTDVNTATITFPVAVSGYAIASLGGSNITQINNAASSTFATTGSNTFVGNQTFSGSLIPAGPYTNNTSSYDLGSATAAWRDLYVSNGSIKMISGSNSASIQFDNGTITFTGAPVTLPSSSTSPTSSFALTASLALRASGSLTGSLFGTASWATNAITSSFVTPYEGAWISYTPSWTAASVNPSIGNGSLQGWYKLVGKTCFVRGNIVMGSTTTFGSGEWYVSMPFTASHADAILMTANLLDNGTAWYNATVNGARAGFNFRAPIQYQGGAGTALDVNATQPFTWTNSDRFLWNGSYEIA